MRNHILAYVSIFISFSSAAQNQDSWTSFWNKDTTLIGYKDKNGIVKIGPKFTGVTIAYKFDDIIAVSEEINEDLNNYYLTKAGRIVGKDSLHMFDNTADCESEGFIRFHDRKTDKTGMFDKNGNIVIPADYNELTRVMNGMIIALKGAEKKYRGEHYSWKGGKVMLIDTNNRILIDSFNYKTHLNFFSVLISSQPNTDAIRQNFKGVNGQYYSFVDFDKEFMVALRSSLLKNFTKQDLLGSTYKNITFWKEPAGWVSEPKTGFINRNFELIQAKLLQLNSKTCDYHIFTEGLNPYIYEPDEYNIYFNNCRESKDWIYPVKNIVISYMPKKDLVQDHFEFLRTENGYKLISISINNGKLK